MYAPAIPTPSSDIDAGSGTWTWAKAGATVRTKPAANVNDAMMRCIGIPNLSIVSQFNANFMPKILAKLFQ